MNYKVYLYVIFWVVSLFVLNGVNFEKIIKSKRTFEAKALFIMLSIIMSYILTNFVYDFLEVSKLY